MLAEKERGKERERGRDGESGSLVQAAGSAAFLSLERGRNERWNVTWRERKREDLSGGTLKGQERTRKKERLPRERKSFQKVRGEKKEGELETNSVPLLGEGKS